MILWEQRGVDVLAQIALIFAGVLGVIGLLSEDTSKGEEASPALEIETRTFPELNSKLNVNGFHQEPELVIEPEEAQA